MRKNTLLFYFALFSTLTITSCSSTSNLLNHSLFSSKSSDEAHHTVSYQPENPEFWQGGTQTIWGRLQDVPLSKLEASQSMPDATEAAWIKLAIISKKDSTNTPQLVHDLNDWRKLNPSHPGNQLFPNEATLSTLANAAPPKNITLMLPLQGPFTASGSAVRDGFLSAYYEELAKTSYQQTISFTDTSKNPNMSALYQESVNKGANIIVGPLLKDNVKQLTSTGNFTIPTLALNYTEIWLGSLPNNLYQFGLSPLDEAKQVADRASEGGHSHALIIAPQNDWGQRVVKTLSDRWTANGGKITETYFFNPKSDLSKDIPRLLHVDTKVDTAKSRDKLANNKANLEKQRRQDFDVVFLLAPPQSAREIMPLLRFYYVDNVPIYATSVVYSGKPDPAKDSDLNGINFADIPWIINGNQAPAVDSDNINRLYAVGRDAYLISHELQRFAILPNFPIYGATGALTLNAQHQFNRRLPMAQMHDGHL
ncbi:MAG: penicillin-binding protein activator [Gammaproteobacteria bacterium]|nr:penicillin-binding protein activator [Gammaproteobacteria bacterium]